MAGDMAHAWLRFALAASVLAAMAGPAAAQFVSPPPPAPILPPNFNQQQQAPRVGYRCSTQVGICVLNAPGQVGFRCSCSTPRGAVPGQIIP